MWITLHLEKESVTKLTQLKQQKKEIVKTFMLYSVICVLPVCYRAKGTKFCQQYCIVKIQP